MGKKAAGWRQGGILKGSLLKVASLLLQRNMEALLFSSTEEQFSLMSVNQGGRGRLQAGTGQGSDAG